MRSSIRNIIASNILSLKAMVVPEDVQNNFEFSKTEVGFLNSS